ncbi:type I restriction endonuclease subunit R [Clavibacter michiganensis]|uniref:type I restriction endonuclease subunit R n=1 Tax=Clavibacter michiganensis TaxID=28447 RepID=UPI0026DC848F|nr:type I restriction endonuclease [Clavibacter michiganensis]MDO4081666.1 type I restriction endonuclease [Clavibacter michiganensis]MDO4086880.1 type I restriction endonuclease [Clavibacter michiganensis]MDO4097613.1 type I restriction endonuclease [Clavibacter michiganensis]
MMAVQHEEAFETELCAYLASAGWECSPNDKGYDRDRALFPADVFAWLEATQPEQLDKLVKPGAPEASRELGRKQILDRIIAAQATDTMNGGGTLAVLKSSVSVLSAKFSLFQKRPANELNPKTLEDFAANRLRVMRQVRYSGKNSNRIDLVLFVNGIPVSTIELKTDLTQDLAAGLKQYAQDRKPAGEPLLTFGRGALVHFVVTNEEVHMTTKLDGTSTRFLPFNRGKGNGAGNKAIAGTSPTAYFWEQILQRETWLDLLGRFLHYRFEEKVDPIDGKKTYDKFLRFPRYHQWRAVTRLERTVRDDGPGENYLIQHSAGSGKTDSIAWTAHRMAQLHDLEGRKVFDGVIVVSDRQVLDGQLRRAVEQLETTSGVFQPITSGGDASKSKQLADALLARKQIIGVTLQTFPHALDIIEKETGLAGRHYAVIADEAHSSQSGEAAASLEQVLTAGKADPDYVGDAPIDTEDVLADVMARKAGIGAISFIAFTATPKGKTVELFGREDESGTKRAFDLYSMKQAIQEGFILDVLKNYLPYSLAFSLAHKDDASGVDVEIDTNKAGREIMTWVRLHPTNIAQKVAVIVEHFRANVRSELGGRAKAMIVTGSRKEAVRYKLAIDAYLEDHKLTGELGSLVAFSGSVDDKVSGPDEFTETSMNPGLKGRALEKAFAGDDFQVMIVANKFQTGFDQPLLVGMYVDKKLSGITAVQTLSRLNRVIPGKENTYILDFVNDPEQILAAFQTYYEDAELTQPSDPNIIHDMLGKLRSVNVVDTHDVDAVVDAWLNKTSHNKLYSHIKGSRDVFWTRWNDAVEASDDLEKARLEEFRGTVNQFVRAYDFLSQIMDYGDTDVEKWAIFLRVYRRVIERQDSDPAAINADDIVLTHYRLRKLDAKNLGLVSGETGELSGFTGAGSSTPHEPKYGLLQDVIDKINGLFAGTDVDEINGVSAAETILRHVVDNPKIQAEAMANTPVDFETSPTIAAELEDVIYASAAGHSNAMKALLQKSDFGSIVNVLVAMGLYEKTRGEAERAASAG